jgi:3-oxoacyl-[acyl-carrier protein] reductase
VDLGIEGKVALVTGASAGLGFAVASALAAEGARVAITSRSGQRIEAAARKIGARGYIHETSDIGRVPALVALVEQQLGPIDILVTNTGGPPPSADPLGYSDAQWEAAYRDLMLAPIALIQKVLPGMRQRHWGRILNLSSSAVREPIPNIMLSSAHRSGILAAFKTLARHVAADGVTVNSVLPGRIATQRIIDLSGSLQAAQKAAATEVPAGRLGRVDEFGAAAAFLCSEPAAYITGVSLLVDGGLTRSI